MHIVDPNVRNENLKTHGPTNKLKKNFIISLKRRPEDKNVKTYFSSSVRNVTNDRNNCVQMFVSGIVLRHQDTSFTVKSNLISCFTVACLTSV